MKRSVWVMIAGMLVPLAVQAADVPSSIAQNTPPAIDAASYVLMDYTTGQVLAQANADQRRNPASLTKLMTGLVIDHALDQHKIGLDDVVTVGNDAWAQGNPVFKGSSLMFLKPGDRVTVRDLSRGIIIDSGNDACVAMADYVAGSQAAFVKLMNEKSAQLGLQNTHFETVHGLDAPGQFTTAGDLAVISRAIIMSEPAEYHMYSEKSLTWNGITQQNRNGLLWDKNLRTEIQPFNNPEELLQQLPTLPTREYSIASIPSQQVLRLVVRQQRDENGQLGLGSGWLTEFASLKQSIALRIRTNESFHLIDDNRPIICIGNGTGIAGLMSLLQQRNRQDYSANWLIFGERQREHDFFYQETIEAWKNMGTLQRVDLAFSRDQAQRIYVQDVMREQADELISWIDQGAVIYVCGSMDGMGSGVDQALIDILGEEKVDALRQAGRYRRDVY